eukprot:TRINITY_DN59163_c0_g1_i1.p1 TRINITY_DN59163_c0_g1~~TRINITY_DN59163_c0_g1_i1.p1  ORF type:complete len:604 (+),score=167.32 TRINITY_DN59163_c0_g1_i1:118-1929(+)
MWSMAAFHVRLRPCALQLCKTSEGAFRGRLPGRLQVLFRAQGRWAGSWSRSDGQRPRAVVIHPRLPGDSEAAMYADAGEALALARAVNWEISGLDNSEFDDGIDEESDEEEDASDDDDVDEEGFSPKDCSELVRPEHILRIDRVDPRFYFHIADLGRIAVKMAKTQSDILFVNAPLSPTQQYNIEAALDLACRAKRSRTAAGGKRGRKADDEDFAGTSMSLFDRHRLVLAIFARRATSQVAKIRIAIAEAQQAKVKLGAAASSGTSSQLMQVAEMLAKRIPGCSRDELLPRSGGAKGVSTSFNSSPQKTRQKQQRALEDKEKMLREELEKLRTHRTAQRQRRKHLNSLALVGYTNVGKSAMVNRLTGSSLLVRNGVFVTLDVAARRVPLPSGGECYMLDSVGFVKDLPLELVDAFQATVEELQAADVVLHVRDMSSPNSKEHGELVREVLEKAGIDMERRVLEVWNKSDLLTAKEAKMLHYVHQKTYSTPVYLVSALSGEGFEALLQGLDDKLHDLAVRAVFANSAQATGAIDAPRRGKQQLRIPQDLSPEEASELWQFLGVHCKVVEESISSDENGATVLECWLDDVTRTRLTRKFGAHLFA